MWYKTHFMQDSYIFFKRANLPDENPLTAPSNRGDNSSEDQKVGGTLLTFIIKEMEDFYRGSVIGSNSSVLPTLPQVKHCRHHSAQCGCTLITAAAPTRSRPTSAAHRMLQKWTQWETGSNAFPSAAVCTVMLLLISNSKSPLGLNANLFRHLQ